MNAVTDVRILNGAAGATLALPRALLPLVLTAAALILALFAGRAVQPALNRPLTALRVDGALTHLTPAQVAGAAALVPGTHIFDADLRGLRARVEALPWVGRARVSRVWPDTLEVRVWERNAAARWGDERLLDSDGSAFTPPASELARAPIAALPRLSGPDGRESEVIAAYRGLDAALRTSEFAPEGLTLDARGEWRMRTAHGIEVRLGDGDPLAHAPLLLGTIRRTLAPVLAQVGYIDLRYTNGFSVGWMSQRACDSLDRALATNASGTTSSEQSGPEERASGQDVQHRPRTAGTACGETATASPAMAVASDKITGTSGSETSRTTTKRALAKSMPPAATTPHAPVVAPAAAKDKT